MHPKAYIKNYLWNRLVEYHNMSYEKYDMTTWYGSTTDTRRTSKHWDIIHHCHYRITKLWGTNPDNKLKDTVKLLEPSWGYSNSFPYGSHPWSPWYNSYTPSRRKYFWRGYREEVTKYRRRPHHEKKVLTVEETNKKAWRAKKKGKKHKPNYKRRHNPGRSYKEIEHRSMRRWVKERLYNEDWDLEHGYKWRCTSPWDWD